MASRALRRRIEEEVKHLQARLDSTDEVIRQEAQRIIGELRVMKYLEHKEDIARAM